MIGGSASQSSRAPGSSADLISRHPRWVAVGTPVAQGPPHRSQRAALPHWALTLGTNVKALFRPGMLNACVWEPSGNKATHPAPVHASSLAAPAEPASPVSRDLGTKRRDRIAVAGDGIVLSVPPDDAAEPSTLFGDRIMPASP